MNPVNTNNNICFLKRYVKSTIMTPINIKFETCQTRAPGRAILDSKVRPEQTQFHRPQSLAS